jgi:Putative Ig domain
MVLTLNETSAAGPALASLNGVLYLAWAGTRNGKLNIMTSTDAGASFGHLITSTQTSPAAPGLCASPDGMFITWTGTGNTKLNVAPVNLQAGVATGIGQTAGNTVTVTNPGNQVTSIPPLGAPAIVPTLQIQASDSASGQTLTYTATGLPAGLSINPATGLITGVPATAGTFPVTVTATDTTGASGSAAFGWTIGSNIVTVTSPGNQVSSTGAPVRLQIQASDSASGQTLTYTATGLPAGVTIDSATGLITGASGKAGVLPVTVTATDTTGASGSARFDWSFDTKGIR